MSKNRVTPIKQLTIPRLELQAAVLSAKVDAMLRKQLDIEITASYFWVDSELVLKYIKNTNKRFHVFVGNRVSLILQLTKPEQWNFISGKNNPADIISRGQNIDGLDKIHGSRVHHFLELIKMNGRIVFHISSIIEIQNIVLSEKDPEVKQETGKQKTGCSFASSCAEESIEKLFQHHSDWYKLKRSVAWILKFKQWLQKRVTSKGLSVKDIREA